MLIHPNLIIQGAYTEDPEGLTDAGSAYVFTRSGASWTQEAKLTDADKAGLSYFGGSVSVSGDTAVIGAYLDDDKGNSSGSAYVFVRAADSTWSQQAKLTAPDGAAIDDFGWSVSVSGGTAVIGAHLYDDQGDASGSAYGFIDPAPTGVNDIDDDFILDLADNCRRSITLTKRTRTATAWAMPAAERRQ